MAISEKKATSTRPRLGDGGLAWLHFHPPWLDLEPAAGSGQMVTVLKDQFRVAGI